MTRSKNTDDGPVQSLLKSLNESLDQFGADFQVSATVEVPLKASVRGEEFKTHMRVLITEDNGWQIQDPEEQVRRIKQEIRRQIK